MTRLSIGAQMCLNTLHFLFGKADIRRLTAYDARG